MKLFTSQQIREIDKFTIENKPIASIDLMESAANELFKKIAFDFSNEEKLIIFAGPGNNGGDGLALARMLTLAKYDTITVFCDFSANISADCKINLKRLESTKNAILINADEPNNLPNIENRIVIDCLFGTGLARPIEGYFAKVISIINSSTNTIISVDIPSGLFGEDNSNNNGEIVRANKTYTIGYLPISSMFAQNYPFYGDISVLDIGLLKTVETELNTPYYIIDKKCVSEFRRLRKRFEHKGNFGHSLIIAGSFTKAGAAVLAAKACLKSGTGLLTVHVPIKLIDVLQATIPEAMVSDDKDECVFSGIDNFANYSAAGIGPGLGADKKSVAAFAEFIKAFDKPLVIDADGLNILASNKKLIKHLKPGTILTPHPKEFERLFGSFESTFQSVEFMRDFTKNTGIIIIRKDGITAISIPNGKVYFNNNGNPGMATGGSGDVLTGIIASLLAQNYKPEMAAILAVYLHSVAGDFALKQSCWESLTATNIVESLHLAFRALNIDY